MTKNKILQNIKQSGIVSLTISVLFAFYNIYLGVAHNYSFGWSIAFYYVFLSCARGLLLKNPKISDKNTNTIESVTKKAIRIRVFKHCMAAGILLATINLLLIAPISLMVLQQREYNLGLIAAIAVATYTTYKTTTAIIHYVKSAKIDDIFQATLRAVNLTDALVSLLTLQNTMIVANGSANDEGMKLLTIYTSLAIYVAIVLISIFCLKRLCKSKKVLDDQQA